MKVKPRYLSAEHAAQAERFQGYPYDPEDDARQQALAKFKHRHHQLVTARDTGIPPQSPGKHRKGRG